MIRFALCLMVLVGVVVGGLRFLFGYMKISEAVNDLLYPICPLFESTCLQAVTLQSCVLVGLIAGASMLPFVLGGFFFSKIKF